MLASNPSKVQTDIMDLWNQNISHFGYVDIGRIYVDEPTIERVLQVLKVPQLLGYNKRASQIPGILQEKVSTRKFHVPNQFF